MIKSSHTTCPDLAGRELLLQRVPSNTFENKNYNEMKIRYERSLLQLTKNIDRQKGSEFGNG